MSFNYYLSDTPLYLGTAAKQNDETNPDTSHMFIGYLIDIWLNFDYYDHASTELSSDYNEYIDTCSACSFVVITPSDIADETYSLGSGVVTFTFDDFTADIGECEPFSYSA